MTTQNQAMNGNDGEKIIQKNEDEDEEMRNDEE